ncbi:NADH:flavin oxidoreductase/NADH oxidase [Arthrobacter sp. NPDC055585]
MMDENAPAGTLFTPLSVRGTTLSNRAGVSPMCMYSATEGFANDFHLAHLGRFALGGAGLVIVEATAVEPRGRISHHDLGLWDDAQTAGLARIATFLSAHGTVPGIQLAHAGRRASVREPWHAGAPLDESDAAAGLAPWPVVGPSPTPAGTGWQEPKELDAGEIRESVDAWVAAAERAVRAGFKLIELHGAHGYLLHSFLSPVSNQRTDEYGGNAEKRMRYPLEVIRAVRAAIPDDVILSYRVSAVDGVTEGGTPFDAVVDFARRAGEAGVDVIDTSSGGISADRSVDTRVRRGFAFHADFARELRRQTGMLVACVGFVVDPEQATRLIEEGSADIVLLGREMLDNPNWVQHARRQLGADEAQHWDQRFGSALTPRLRTLEQLDAAGETPLSRFEQSSAR